jgi:hypothetical protein
VLEAAQAGSVAAVSTATAETTPAIRLARVAR